MRGEIISVTIARSERAHLHITSQGELTLWSSKLLWSCGSMESDATLPLDLFTQRCGHDNGRSQEENIDRNTMIRWIEHLRLSFETDLDQKWCAQKNPSWEVG